MQTARSSSVLPGASLTPAHSHGCSEEALSFADVLGRKNSLLILGLPFSSFRKTSERFAEGRWFLRRGQPERVFGGVGLVYVLRDSHCAFR